MEKVKEQVLQYLREKYNFKTASFEVESGNLSNIVMNRQDDDVDQEIIDLNTLCSIINLFDQCGKENMISYSKNENDPNHEQAKQIVDSYYKLLKQFDIEEE